MFAMSTKLAPNSVRLTDNFLGVVCGTFYLRCSSSLASANSQWRVTKSMYSALDHSLSLNFQHSVKPLSTFDVSPDGSLLASGHEDGAIVIQSTSPSNTDPSKQLTPHLATLLSVRFFPSNEVLLTSSSDFTLSIISAIDLSVPRKLKGHTRGVTDTAIISRGRNILSSGKDGTLRLWDVGGGKQIKVMGMPTFSPVNKISLGTIGDEWVHPPPDGTAVERAITTSPNEVETSDKAVYCALQNGQFSIIDLGTKSPVFTSSPSPGLAEANAGSKTALNAIAYLASHSLLATGTTGGLISLFDTRHLSSPLFVCQRNTASIEDLIFSVAPDPKLLVATEDGLPFCLDIKPEGPRVVEEFVGWDSEAIRGVRYAAGAVWCAGQDGIVRKY